MRLIKTLEHKDERQIWRILISGSDKLILETRDVATKEVFYHCIDLSDFKGVFYNLQFEEKCRLGIETIYKEILFFHKFPKPDLPGHKEIIAFDLASQKILWSNNDLSFLFAADGKVYGFRQGFEERYFTALDYMTGEVIEDLGTDYRRVNSLRSQSEDEKDLTPYLFPRIYSTGGTSSDAGKIIDAHIEGLNPAGNIEFAVCNDLLFFNYHITGSGGLLTNKFAAYDLVRGELLIDEILNFRARTLFTDSFFVYKEFLFLLREKNEVIIYRIEYN